MLFSTLYPYPLTALITNHPELKQQRLMPKEKPRQSVPFEPHTNKQRKPTAKKGTPIVKPKTASPAMAERGSGYIPDVVSKRMIRRVLVFCGIPILMGMGIFLGSYWIIINHLFKVPNTVVLLTSMACLGLSVLGLSYGILSACWEEDSSIKGSLLGWQEFKVNFGRMADAYRASKQMQSSEDR
jgi:Photosynthesis affected mutant 68